MKTFILDTNVIVNDPLAIYGFGHDNQVIVPMLVIQELDGLKTRRDSLGTSARMAVREIDKMRVLGKLYEGVALPNGGTLKVDADMPDPTFKIVGETTIDHYILQMALSYDGILVTEDQQLRILASSMGVEVDRYRNAVVEPQSYYAVSPEVELGPDVISQMQKRPVDIGSSAEMMSGFRYAQLVNAENGKKSALGKYNPETQMMSSFNSNPTIYGIGSKNREQAFALDALMDPSITLVVLAGQAGTGKTLLAMAAGLEQVHSTEPVYDKMMISRPVVPMGKELGFLPGSLNEKLDPWMGSIHDSLDKLVKPDKHVQNVYSSTLAYMMDTGTVNVQALQYIRGRSLPHQYLLVDEAQQLTPHEVKTIVTRAGEGTKVVFTGDPYQIDSPYLDQYNNGLAFIIDRFNNQSCFANITLHKGERSALAELASQLLH